MESVGDPETDLSTLLVYPTCIQHENLQEKVLAFVMGLSSRLGKESVVFAFLCPDTCRYIFLVPCCMAFGEFVLVLFTWK